MNEGSQTAVADTRGSITWCPEWCTRDHGSDNEIEDFIYHADTFGGVTVWMNAHSLDPRPLGRRLENVDPARLRELGIGHDDTYGVSVDNVRDEYRPWPEHVAELRQLAAECLAAAEWLEAHR